MFGFNHYDRVIHEYLRQKINSMKLEKKATFTKNFIKANELADNEFDEWLLTSGMLFEAENTWWGDQKRRKSQHEGIDLGLFRKRNQEVIGFNEKTIMSAIFDGVVVGVFNDFLGKSVFMRHEIANTDNRELCSIFGHIKLGGDICSGKILKEGEVVGSVADVGKSGVKPHLHITMGWLEKEITDDVCDWNVIGKSEVMELVDPIEIIGRYSIVPASTILSNKSIKK